MLNQIQIFKGGLSYHTYIAKKLNSKKKNKPRDTIAELKIHWVSGETEKWKKI